MKPELDTGDWLHIEAQGQCLKLEGLRLRVLGWLGRVGKGGEAGLSWWVFSAWKTWP